MAAIVASCDALPLEQGENDPLASEIELVSGGSQEGEVAQQVPEMVVVRVLDEAGAPLSGVGVAWSVESGGDWASIAGASPTGEDGTAAGTWVLGEHAGVQSIRVSVPGADSVSPLIVTANVGPGPVATLIVDPGTLRLVVGEESAPLATAAYDQYDNEVTGYAVSWSSDTEAVATVDSTGVVTARAAGIAWIIASSGAGSDSAAVTVESGAPSIGLDSASLAAGATHTCALDADGRPYCWGHNYYGQIGDGETTGSGGGYRATPVAVFTTQTFTGIWAGDNHTCGLTAAGVAYCWGDNEYGQLGDGTTTLRNVPVEVSTTQAFTQIGGGTWHTCGLTEDGAAHCWGRNEYGQLGDGTTTARSTPAPVTGSLAFSTLSLGSHHACALTAEGAAHCWGYNSNGQLGDGSTTSALDPVAVSTTVAFSSLEADGYHACGIDSGGVAYCWGYNGWGHLGDGTTTDRTTPVAVSTEERFVSIAAGSSHNCGITGDGAVFCWGGNSNGTLGDGTTTHRFTPVPVSTTLSFPWLEAGVGHTCGRADDGALYCWGTNSSYQLGDGTNTHRHTPTPVAGFGATTDGS